MTINMTPALYDQIARLADVLQLEIGATARMLIVEALATRDLYPKIRPRRDHRTRRHRARANELRTKSR